MSILEEERIARLEREKGEALEECTALRGQFKALKERVAAAEAQLKGIQERHSQEIALVEQKAKTQEQVLKYLRDRVEECELENQAIQEEYKTVKEQKKRAEEKFSELQREISRRDVVGVDKLQEEGELKDELDALRMQCIKLKEQLLQEKGELAAAQKLLLASQEESRLLKERTGKEFEREREALLEEMRHLKRRSDGVGQLEAAKKEGEERLKESQRRLDDAMLLKQLADQELRQLKEGLKQKELLLEESKAKILRYQQEKYEGEARFNEFKASIGQFEAEAKQAKIHLAKKLKETNQIQEAYEALEKEKISLAASLQEREERCVSLEEAVKMAERVRQEELLHQNKRELAKSEEISRLKKETERLKEKHILFEAEIAELKAFKEKHTQLQGLIQELGGAMKEPEKMGEKFVVKPSPQAKKKKMPDLFDNVPESPYYKKNLFE